MEKITLGQAIELGFLLGACAMALIMYLVARFINWIFGIKKEKPHD
jgi:hypothetical protein